MRSFFAAVSVLSLALSVAAISVTAPNNQTGWTSTGTNTLSWNRVNTDPTTFAVVLTNLDRSILPVNNQVLVNSVDASSQSSISIAAPSGGFPVGQGFRVNLVKDATDVNSILAQSDNFEIKAGGAGSQSSGGSTVVITSSSTGAPTTALATITTAGQTITIVPTVSSGSGSGTDLNPSATGSPNAASPRYADFGLLGAMLVIGGIMA